MGPGAEVEEDQAPMHAVVMDWALVASMGDRKVFSMGVEEQGEMRRTNTWGGAHVAVELRGVAGHVTDK